MTARPGGESSPSVLSILVIVAVGDEGRIGGSGTVSKKDVSYTCFKHRIVRKNNETKTSCSNDTPQYDKRTSNPKRQVLED